MRQRGNFVYYVFFIMIESTEVISLMSFIKQILTHL